MHDYDERSADMSIIAQQRAKEAAYRSPIMAGAMLGTQAPPRPTEMQLASGELAGLHETLLEARALLTAFVSNMFGPSTEAGVDCAEKQSFGGGAMGDLRRQIGNAREVTDEVRSLARRLGQLG